MSKLGKMRRNRRLAMEGRQILAAVFPECFAGKGAKKRPIKIGIYHDIRSRMPGMRGAMVSAALRDYTTGASYLKAMVEKAYRVDLDGEVVGEVTADEEAAARARLEKVRKTKKAAPHGGRPVIRHKHMNIQIPGGGRGDLSQGAVGHEVRALAWAST